MITLENLTNLISKKDEIVSELQTFGETEIKFYDALDGILGVISKYNADLDEKHDCEEAIKYLIDTLGLESEDIDFNHDSSGLLTPRMKDECIGYEDLTIDCEIFVEIIREALIKNAAQEQDKLYEELPPVEIDSGPGNGAEEGDLPPPPSPTLETSLHPDKRDRSPGREINPPTTTKIIRINSTEKLKDDGERTP